MSNRRAFTLRRSAAACGRVGEGCPERAQRVAIRRAHGALSLSKGEGHRPLRVYLNGVLNATRTPGTGKNANFGSCNTLHIGTDVDTGGDGCTTNLGNYWRGRIDDLRIYDRALTDAQIAAIAAGSL